MNNVTNTCPYCDKIMHVTRMSCHHCNTAIEAAFPSSRISNLPSEHQRFIEMFVLAGGSLKEIAKQTGVSYPTVRSRLDKVIDSLREEIAKTSQTQGTILDAITSLEEPLSAEKLIKSI